jgi:ferredoxin
MSTPPGPSSTPAPGVVGPVGPRAPGGSSVSGLVATVGDALSAGVQGWRARALDLYRRTSADLAALTADLRGAPLPPVVRVGRRGPRAGGGAERTGGGAGVGAQRSDGGAPGVAPVAPSVTGAVAQGPARSVAVTVRLAGGERTLAMRTDRPILDQALAAGLALPSSCRAGGCGACRLRGTPGAVTMPADHCLSPAEVADGFVLTCVGCPAGDLVLEGPP